MTDKELLEMAAKAAWIKVKGSYEDEDTLAIKPGPGMPTARWNPLADDGDALRLAVKLDLISFFDCYEAISDAQREADIYAATRRAIVRAAAEIGKAMK